MAGEVPVGQVAVPRAHSEGTYVSSVLGCVNRRPSYEKKKKALFFQIGPPRTPPKSFWRSGGCCGTPGFGGMAFKNQSLASKMLLRRYSNPSPWKALVPVGVEIESCPPGVRPYSCAKELAWMLNSWIESCEARLL